MYILKRQERYRRLSLVLKLFTRYRIAYAIINPDGKEYARIDLFKSTTIVGQVLIDSAITPSSFAALVVQQIHLYFRLSHFDTIRFICVRNGI